MKVEDEKHKQEVKKTKTNTKKTGSWWLEREKRRDFSQAAVNSSTNQDSNTE